MTLPSRPGLQIPPLAWWEMLGICTLARLFMVTGTPSVCGRGPRRHLAWNIFDIALCFVRAKGLPTSRTLAMDALMKQRHCGIKSKAQARKAISPMLDRIYRVQQICDSACGEPGIREPDPILLEPSTPQHKARCCPGPVNRAGPAEMRRSVLSCAEP